MAGELLIKFGGKDPNGLAKGIEVTNTGEVKTKPTGTLVELGKKRSIEVEPGTTVVVFDKIPVYSNLFFYAVQADSPHEYSVSYQWNAKDPDSVNSFPSSVLMTDEYTERYVHSDRQHVLGDRLWLRMTNNASTKQTYHIYVWGVD